MSDLSLSICDTRIKLSRHHLENIFIHIIQKCSQTKTLTAFYHRWHIPFIIFVLKSTILPRTCQLLIIHKLCIHTYTLFNYKALYDQTSANRSELDFEAKLLLFFYFCSESVIKRWMMGCFLFFRPTEWKLWMFWVEIVKHQFLEMDFSSTSLLIHFVCLLSVSVFFNLTPFAVAAMYSLASCLGPCDL